MNTDTLIKTYCRKVWKCLDCDRKEKAKLIRGLYEELSGADQQARDYSDLLHQYGTPENMAATLRAALKEEHILKFQRKRRRKNVLLLSGGILIVVLLAVALVFLLDYMRTKVPLVEDTIIFDTSPDPSGLDELDWNE